MQIKNLTYLVFFSLIFSGANAQSLEWARRFGGSGEDVVRNLHVDEEGNIYTTGYFTDDADFDISESEYTLTSNGFYDVFVQKSSADGELVWARGFGSGMFDYGKGVTTDSEGNVYVTGVYTDTLNIVIGEEEVTSTSNGGEDVFIIKLDMNGNFLWLKTFGGEHFDESAELGTDAEGNLYVSGFFNGTVAFDGENPEAVFSGAEFGNTNFIMKYNANGEFQWVKAYGNDDFGGTISMVVNEEGDQFISGFYSGVMDLDPSEEGEFLTTATGFEGGIFMLSLDTDGEFRHAYFTTCESINNGYDVKLDTQGNIYLSGSFAGTANFNPLVLPLELTSGGSEDGFIVKLNPDAEFQWVKQLYSSEMVVNYEIAVDGSDNVYATGIFINTTDFDPSDEDFELTPASETAVDYYLLKLNGNGDFINAWQFAGVNFSDYIGISCDTADNLYLSGAYELTVDLDPDTGNETLVSSTGFRDSFIIKLSPESTTHVHSVDGRYKVSAYPNPAKESFQLSVEEQMIGQEFRLYDISGKMVASGKVLATATMVDLRGLDNGLYLLYIGDDVNVKVIKY